jgi:hypothetical protein
MSAIEKETEPIASAWKIFDRQRGPRNSVMNNAAFGDFFLPKEKN